jgi:glycerophosphoryl diester phosphodiesterase
MAEMEPGLRVFFSYPADYAHASERRWMTPAVSAAAFLMRVSLPLRLGSKLRPARAIGAAIWYRAVSPGLVTTARRLGVELYTWTVDEAAQMSRLASMGVGGITSNRPDLLMQIPPRIE